MSKGFASSYRIVLLSGGLFACFAALGVRLIFLHVVDREELLRTITKARYQLIEQQARRGDIVDARGAILATSRSLLVVGVDPMELRPQDEKNWPQLAALLHLPEPDLRRIFSTKFQVTAPATPATAASPASAPGNLVFNLNLAPTGSAAVPVATNAAAAEKPTDNPAAANADEDDTDLEPNADEKGRRAIRWAKLGENVTESLYAEIEKLGIKGVYGRRVYRRVYPNNQLAAHLIGFVNHEQHPVAGMEFYADFYLRGQNGWRVGERDGRRRELAQFRARDVPAADGYTVVLSIKSAVQDIAEQELAYLAQKFQPLKATIIVSDPHDGFILAMANYPSYNPNEYNKIAPDDQAVMRNVAVADVYEPGSVFKIVAASGALEEGLVQPQTTFDCTLERITYQGRSLDLPGEDHHFTHPLSVAEIMAHSSNKGAAQLGMLLGEERLYNYAHAFGFGHSLGFPVGGEVPGELHPYKKWGADITRIPMGHAVSATALQMHQAMSVIANRGVLLRPQIIRKIRDAQGKEAFAYGPVELGRVVSERTAETMAVLLMGVATKDGTAPEAAIPGYDVAGKTGTSQKLVEELQRNGTTKLVYSNKHHVASFIGFFPATARPGERQVAISVIVDDADAHALNGVAYGKSVAAPSFKNIGEKLIPILDIKAPNQPASPALFATANDGGRRR
jgi:cell division protein FtsI (penicillin-binding protein 3)